MDNLSKLNGNNFECFRLDWDTKYFGINSAKVILKGPVTELDQILILDYCKAFEFVTISNIGNSKENNYWIGERSNAFLTDINIQFEKKNINETVYLDNLTEVYNSYPLDKNVTNIAKSAYLYSRFFNDPLLPRNQAENIYLHWTECAFNQDNKYFVITKRDGNVAGYILFSINVEEKTSTIELIAVDQKYRGQRVGRSLISSMEDYIHNKEIRKIKVGTQVDNVTAIQFYIACGFQYISCSSVYHLWTKKITEIVFK